MTERVGAARAAELALPSADPGGGLATTVVGSPAWNLLFADLLGPVGSGRSTWPATRAPARTPRARLVEPTQNGVRIGNGSTPR